MKKVLLVLALGLIFMSCSKEEINPFEDCQYCMERTYQQYPNSYTDTSVECQEEVSEGGIIRIYCIYNEDDNN